MLFSLFTLLQYLEKKITLQQEFQQATINLYPTPQRKKTKTFVGYR